MFDVPVDAWYVWLGLVAASVAVLGVAADLPGRPPPDATAAAAAVDTVAAGGHAAATTHPVNARSARVGPRRIALRNRAGTASAAFAFGPVTPAPPGSPLRRVLRGHPPERVFGSPAALARAATAARGREPRYRPTDGRLHIRRITWEEVDVTLVGA